MNDPDKNAESLPPDQPAAKPARNRNPYGRKRGTKDKTKRYDAQGKKIAWALIKRRKERMEVIRRANEANTAALKLAESLEPLNELEILALELANVQRLNVFDIFRRLNTDQKTEAWTADRVGALLARARNKLTKAGELELAKPSGYQVADMQLRYDSLVSVIRRELAAMSPDQPAFTMLRAKLAKTAAEIEKMRDDALGTLQGKGPALGALAVAYVSHLREPGTEQAVSRPALAGALVRPRSTPPTPPPGGEQ